LVGGAGVAVEVGVGAGVSVNDGMIGMVAVDSTVGVIWLPASGRLQAMAAAISTRTIVNKESLLFIFPPFSISTIAICGFTSYFLNKLLDYY
jgi:hypothetical protein